MRQWLLCLLCLLSMPAFAQKQSLAERVTALEAKQGEDPARMELVQQVSALKEELRALRGEIEELRNADAQAKESSRNQYLDLDGRMTRLENGGAPAATAAPDQLPPPKELNPAPVKSSGNEKGDYDASLKLLKAGDYVASARGFRAFLDTYPKSALAPNAQYWLGESYYATGNYAPAAAQFKALAEAHPEHNKAAGALLKLGMSQAELKQTTAARATWQKVIDHYAGSDAAKQAQVKLGAKAGSGKVK